MRRRTSWQPSLLDTWRKAVWTPGHTFLDLSFRTNPRRSAGRQLTAGTRQEECTKGCILPNVERMFQFVVCRPCGLNVEVGPAFYIDFLRFGANDIERLCDYSGDYLCVEMHQELVNMSSKGIVILQGHCHRWCFLTYVIFCCLN